MIDEGARIETLLAQSFEVFILREQPDGRSNILDLIGAFDEQRLEIHRRIDQIFYRQAVRVFIENAVGVVLLWKYAEKI